MNRWIGIGRLTKDPVIHRNGDSINARYTLAVDRYGSKDKEQTADFISCIAWGKNGEFAENYLRKGTKIAVEGRIATGSYTKDDGTKVFTTDVVIEKHEFCESKNGKIADAAPDTAHTDPLDVPDTIADSLPFK